MSERPETTFETALAERVAGMVDACTRCGKCVEACPVTGPGGIGATPRAVIDGIIDILRLGAGHEAARRWANVCVLSGECIKACGEGINPRFLLAMTRTTLARATADPREQRRSGVDNFRKVARDVTSISRLQLDDELLDRLGQKADAVESGPQPEFVFYTGCNVLKTPHIALLALDIMDALGVPYRVMGGPSHCCGVVQLRTGDIATSGRFTENTMNKLARSRSGQVVSWCPSCHIQFKETTLPTIEKVRGAKPFEITPFMLYLRGHLGRLRPLLRERVGMRVALHQHPGVHGVVEAAQDILSVVPGVELIDLKQPAIGAMSNYFRALPALRRELQKNELDAAEAAGVDALVAIYHADHRELCAHEAVRPFRILNLLEIVGASMGLRREDNYKRLKIMNDVEAIAADCADLIARHGLDPETTRQAIRGMLEEQPLPLRASRD
ncbi:MAG: (Fe-S)-binding protein [Hyphomicrobiales bacterium]|nr:(Fe-S)-binding protein [Hyphomicrobiales bacterium]